MTPKDSLGDRMKEYEDAYRFYMMRRGYLLIRIDGRAFHTWTKGMERPFDENMMNLMRTTTFDLLSTIDNTVFGYTQSDEISILICDDKQNHTSAWFDNNLQKIVSVSASIATASFNLEAVSCGLERPPATFDSRVWMLPTQIEVWNYFFWRWQDCVRNSIQSFGQSLFSPKELHGKKTTDIIQMAWDEHGLDWHKLDAPKKNGSFCSWKTVDERSKPISESFNLREDKQRLIDMIPLSKTFDVEAT